MEKTYEEANKLEKIFVVWAALCGFIQEIRNYLAAIDAVEQETYQSSLQLNQFIAISQQALERQCILEIEQIFDKAHYRNYRKKREEDNCSFGFLKELCLTEDVRQLFPKGEHDEVVLLLDQCQEQYQQTLPVELRNKLMAHHDIKKIATGQQEYVSFDALKDLIERASEALVLAGVRLMRGDLVFQTLEDQREYFTGEIRKLHRNSI